MNQRLNSTLSTLPPGKQYIVGAAILRQSSQKTSSTTKPQLLIIKRAAHESAFPLHWEIPGGSLEPGETIRQGLAREVFEETGLVVEDVVRELTESSIGVVGGVEWIQYRYLVKVKQPVEVRLDPNEHCDWQWVTEEGAEGLLRASGQAGVMEEVFRIVRGEGQ